MGRAGGEAKSSHRPVSIFRDRCSRPGCGLLLLILSAVAWLPVRSSKRYRSVSKIRLMACRLTPAPLTRRKEEGQAQSSDEERVGVRSRPVVFRFLGREHMRNVTGRFTETESNRADHQG